MIASANRSEVCAFKAACQKEAMRVIRIVQIDFRYNTMTHKSVALPPLLGDAKGSKYAQPCRSLRSMV